MKKILMCFIIIVFLASCIRTPCSDEYYKAIETSDFELCESARDIREGFNCKEHCIWQVANSTGNPELCGQIDYNKTILAESRTSIRDFCYGMLAYRLNDTSICNKITKESTQHGCIYAMNITRT